ncbi:MAG: hypothetical protein LBK44_06185 [Spirochaetales bacterium]|jgi:hypothetical protein|nr:hypothetical protein [Spirochaetales bacterium]
MSTKIHYSDNIFYLQTLIKTVRNGLSLEIDPEYFQDRLLEDILFLNVSLNKIYASLKANAYLIRKGDYLRSLLRAKRDFAGILQNIVEKKLPGAECLMASLVKLKSCEEQQQRDIKEIRGVIENSRAKGSGPESDVISEEEFRFLFTPAEQPDKNPQPDSSNRQIQ